MRERSVWRAARRSRAAGCMATRYGSIWRATRRTEVTEAMNRAAAEVGEAKDTFVSAATRRILERSEW